MCVEQYIVDTVSHGLNKRVGLVSKIEYDKQYKTDQQINAPYLPAIFAQKGNDHQNGPKDKGRKGAGNDDRHMVEPAGQGHME